MSPQALNDETTQQAVAPGVSLRTVAMAVWALGAIGLLTVLGWQSRRHMRRLLRDAAPAPEELVTWVRTLAEQFGVRREVRVVLSPRLKVPCLCGLWRSVIVLPQDVIERLHASQQADLIAHELAHVKRWDLQTGWLASVLLCLYWFHPAVWLANLYLRREREMACDDKVLYVTRREGTEYASTMLRVAEGFDGSVPAAAGFLGLFEIADNLLQRIRSVSDGTRSRRPGWATLLTVGLVALVLVPMGTWAQTPPASPMDQEIEQYYAKADADVKELMRMTAQNPRLQGLWLPADTFKDLSGEAREAKVNEILAALRGGQEEEAYYKALTETGPLADPRFVPALTEIAWEMRPGGQDNRARWMAVAALGRIGDRKAVPVLIPLVDHYNLNTRLWARASLVRLTGENFGTDKQAWADWANAQGPETAISPAILEWASRQSEEKMKAAEAQARAQATPPDDERPRPNELLAAAEKEIAEHYASASADVKEYIKHTARGFGRAKFWLPEGALDELTPEQREEKVKYLAELMNGEYGRHLCLGLAEAGVIKDERLLPGLMKVAGYHLENSDYDCRPKWIAVASLGRHDSPSAAPLLADLVDHGNENTRMWARAGMARLTGQNFDGDKKAWAEWWNANGKEPKIDVAQLKTWTPPGQPGGGLASQQTSPSNMKRNWGPEQATGEPDTRQAGDVPTAWASLSTDDQAEWLLLEYAKPIPATRIKVFETYNPGALRKVTAFDAGGKEYEVWAGEDPTPSGSGMGVSEIPARGTAIQRVKLYLDSPAVPGWNEIDAVGLVDSNGATHWATRAEASSTYAEPKQRQTTAVEQIAPAAMPEGLPGDAVLVSTTDNSMEDKRSLGGSGHAIAFLRPESTHYLEAVQFCGSRYGTPEPPDEDFHVYVLNERFEVLADVPFPYSLIERGEMKWYTLRTPSIEVLDLFYIALDFNPHQTKGVYLGMDRNVFEPHSFIGVPEKGFNPVGEKYDWMVHAILSPEATGEKGVMRLADWQPPAAPAAGSDLARLQGAWSGTEEGRPGSKWTATISGNRANFSNDDNSEWYKGEVALNEKADPKQVDYVIQESAAAPYVGRTSRGIYRFDGTTFAFATFEPGTEARPTDFDTEQKARVFAFTKAASPEAAAPSAEQPVPPPTVVSTEPAMGETGVDPALTALRVTFDQDMAPGFSWTGGPPAFPETAGPPRWIDKRTCELPVKLESARVYRVGLNSKSHQNFRNERGVPLRPQVLAFATTGISEEMAQTLKAPTVVSMTPANGDTKVTPSLTALTVTFDKPMGGGFSWTGGGDDYPETTGPPSWSEDRLTCTLPVKLQPNKSYRLGLNSPSHINFQSESGIPLEPIQWTFTTGQ